MAIPSQPTFKRSLVQAFFQSLEKCIRSIQIQAQVKINQILLSGGSPILPEIPSSFCNLFVGVAPVIIADPSTAAVRGAAVYTTLLGGDRNKRLEDFIVLSATNFALGVKVVDCSIKDCTTAKPDLPCESD